MDGTEQFLSSFVLFLARHANIETGMVPRKTTISRILVVIILTWICLTKNNTSVKAFAVLNHNAATSTTSSLHAINQHQIFPWDEGQVKNLPILDSLEEILQNLQDKSNLLLEAPPGAGKTTIVPLALLPKNELKGGKPDEIKILVIEPRRVAARSTALRMANLLKQNVGQTVGYAIRGESKQSTKTRITVMTDGVLLNKLKNDPELAGIDVIILDEFHERGVGSDTVLALCREAQKLLRPDLKIIVMSATLLGEGHDRQESTSSAYSKMINALGGTSNCNVVQSEGRQYPIDIIWGNQLKWRTTPYLPLGRIMKDRNALAETMCCAIEQAVQKTNGDILVFLPGAAEIKRVVSMLRQRKNGQIDVLPLYGALSRDQQDEAIFPSPGAPQRIIVASPIAEASLTLERVTCVVDSGLRREPRCDVDTGMPRLVTTRISKASATQRAGRAGRVQKGICIRIYNEAEFQDQFLEHSPPEIVNTDLSPTMLLLAHWGCSSMEEIVQDLPFVDPPEEASMKKAVQLLQDLGCLEHYEERELSTRLSITSEGQTIAQLPTHPRFATTFVRATNNSINLAGAIAAAFILDDEVGIQKKASPDLRFCVKDLYGQKQQSAKLLQYANRISSFAKQAVQSVLDDSNLLPAVMDNLGLAILPGFVDLVGERKGDASYRGSSYLLSLGRSARLDEIRDASYSYVLVLETTTGDDGIARIRSFVPISRDHLLSIAEEKDIVFTVPSRGHEVRARRVLAVGALELSSMPITAPDSDQIAKILKTTIRELGGVYSALIQTLPSDKRQKVQELCSRLELATKLEGDENDWPMWVTALNNQQNSKEEILLEELVDPWLYSCKSLKEIDIFNILQSSLSPTQQTKLDEFYPSHLMAPDGTKIPVSYTDNKPTAQAKLQQFFGTVTSPTVGPLNNPMPVTLNLMSPSNKLLGSTQDLTFFWKESYPNVRSEMRGQYPKHPWPEKPMEAIATRQTNKQLQKNSKQENTSSSSTTRKKKKQRGKKR